MTIRLDNLEKLEGVAPSTASCRNDDEPVEIIVKVHQPHYLPACVHLRSWISPHLFTAEIPVRLMPSLDGDPEVESVAMNRRLRLID